MAGKSGKAHRNSAKQNQGRSPLRGGGEVRIIGGDWRGRKLPVLDAEGLRPTSDRVRETLFNWLQFDIAGSRCLDMFAGSGALSFEALSRGAAQATLLELNGANAKQLQTNLKTLNVNQPATKATVVQADSLQWLQGCTEPPFDIVFIDPPFHQGLMQQSIDLLFAKQLIKADGWLYLEQENDLPWPRLVDGWYCHREKKTSQVKFGLFAFDECAAK
ncbi:16S rRNA (guanine(966)-N(2))-methyltransferase RsmD [Thiomicrorhabdus sediminis]|uniref:Ribosomal RNA small subunit methyltransferase D n=1 Tax=Thiomicrorhabdus sediminis TaxID=2580412 RepID=A0A4P9K744_9GAMM|nr:16S rRNA (guanine(966)-N(2))-methyltransferase RsmD [Thiomicrorhabdus sediminis]QCU90912.1 16S rRNA (guanine(966)-N(2))-methyltransferase RsmD [Thiomicrorhabdus sediminis]